MHRRGRLWYNWALHPDCILFAQTELEKRRQDWVPPPPAATKGTLFKYIKNVASASEGCVTDE